VHWSEVTTHLPVAMWAVTPTISDGNLLIVGYDHAGGCSRGSFQISIDNITSSSLEASRWEELSPAPYWNTTTVFFPNPPIIAGGKTNDNQATADICVCEKSKNTWTQVGSLK